MQRQQAPAAETVLRESHECHALACKQPTARLVLRHTHSVDDVRKAVKACDIPIATVEIPVDSYNWDTPAAVRIRAIERVLEALPVMTTGVALTLQRYVPEGIGYDVVCGLVNKGHMTRLSLGDNLVTLADALNILSLANLRELRVGSMDIAGGIKQSYTCDRLGAWRLTHAMRAQIAWFAERLRAVLLHQRALRVLMLDVFLLEPLFAVDNGTGELERVVADAVSGYSDFVIGMPTWDLAQLNALHSQQQDLANRVKFYGAFCGAEKRLRRVFPVTSAIERVARQPRCVQSTCVWCRAGIKCRHDALYHDSMCGFLDASSM